MKRLVALLIAAALALSLLLAGCNREPAVINPPVVDPPDIVDPPVPTVEERIAELIGGMSPRRQVEQLFMISLGPKTSTEYSAPNDLVTQFLSAHAPGGYILFAGHITTTEGTRELVDAIMAMSAVAPFIGIDEEGGRISRLTEAGLPGYTAPPSAAAIGSTGDPEQAYSAGAAIGDALSAIGVTVDFAPDADVLTYPENTVIGDRAFSDNAETVAEMVSAFQQGLRDKGLMTGVKHFPGHGGTAGDSHTGLVSIPYDAGHLAAVEYQPFQRAIAEGTELVLVGHILAPSADASGLPASLSPCFVTEALRGQLGFEGLIITDAMDMGAVAEQYGPGEAAVLALLAGVDIVLMPADYEQAVTGVMDALADGRISEARVRTSLERILRTKIEAGLL